MKEQYFYVFLAFGHDEEGPTYHLGCVGANSVEDARKTVVTQYKEAIIDSVMCFTMESYVEFAQNVQEHIPDSIKCYEEVTGNEAPESSIVTTETVQ